jgi:hypothetical protein
MSPPAYRPSGSPGERWCSWGSDAPESSAMGRPGSSAAGSGCRRRRLHPAGEVGRMPRSRLTGTHARPPAAGHGRWRVGTRLRRVLLRWQAPQPCRSRPGATVVEAVDPYAGLYAEPYAGLYAGHLRTPSPPGGRITAGHAPRGGVERPRRVVRFARLIHRRVGVLGGPSARAACGGNVSLPWLPGRAGLRLCFWSLGPYCAWFFSWGGRDADTAIRPPPRPRWVGRRAGGCAAFWAL